MGWVKFTKTGRSFKPKVSVRGDSQIGFNRAAIRDFKLTEYNFAILFFDEQAKRIGIKLTNDKNEEGVCKLRVREEAGASIPARSFIACYNLEGHKRLEAKWDDKDKMIIVKLS